MTFSSAVSVPEQLVLASTPKRKRNTPGPPTPPSSSPTKTKMKLNTNVMSSPQDDGRAGSPRTKVANHFQSLQIDDARVSKLDLKRPMLSADEVMTGQTDGTSDDDNSNTRKRVKVLEIPETPDVHAKRKANTTKQHLVAPKFTLAINRGPPQDGTSFGSGSPQIQGEMDPVIFKSGNPLGKLKSGALKRAYPSINRLSNSKSRSRKRSGTPPLHSSATGDSESDDPPKIVDPERAAQTWHDDEITGHDPSDPEDDGEGINGIGFKPTAAEAYARAQKRKSQMADYKSREAREARARRNERRRGKEKADREESKERRVHFSEAEKLAIQFIV
ncbi:hypothetical protein GLAREA_05065 [Glarea lozoyensis ATCC 20868]|uniref:Uncharacterized protein n=1 Tax=Glarea lozoyensis (strain ATCC 20868 / MF5171) TaxID=1116229 RepID=S3EBP7_GLAL2|nr:uncharacterized protein GLAREA_05065 [Glarea lozoyensis ATCC 20868]EPE35728.1 hypothetical protein GLAREA_05065 [Glarea lozoyensis ATCC 20868]